MKICTYEQASQWAQQHHITSAFQWRTQRKNCVDLALPANPDQVYPDFKTRGGWSAYVGNMSLNNTSIIERLMRLALDGVFDPTAEPHRKQVVKGISGKRHQVDMAYPSVRLIVEYDGAYFHADKTQLDQQKTDDLKHANWNVVRVREWGLNTLDAQWDVVVSRGTANQKIQTVAGHLYALSQAQYLTLDANTQKRLRDIHQRVELGSLLEKIASHQKFLSYEEASQWAVAHKITSAKQWFAQSHRPENLPSSPAQTYPDFLQRGGWGAFLKTKTVAPQQRTFVDYFQASQWAQDNNITTQKQWNEHASQRPDNIPSNPNQVYPQEFYQYGWRGFVNPILRNSGRWATYEQASQWARDNNIGSKTAWNKSKRPINMPAVPDAFYTEFETNGGWGGVCGATTQIHTRRKF